MTDTLQAAPARPSTDERRRHPRAQVVLAVRLHFASVRDFLDAHAEDISESGMFLRTDVLAPDNPLCLLGQVMRLQFEAGNRRVVEGLARTVRVVPATRSSPAGVGVEFIELDDQSRALIAAILVIKLATPHGG